VASWLPAQARVAQTRSEGLHKLTTLGLSELETSSPALYVARVSPTVATTPHRARVSSRVSESGRQSYAGKWRGVTLEGVAKPYRSSRAPICATRALIELSRLADVDDVLGSEPRPILPLAQVGPNVTSLESARASRRADPVILATSF
jgi:hypothetical protein